MCSSMFLSHEKQIYETEEHKTSVTHCRIQLPMVPDVFWRFFFIASPSDFDERSIIESGEGVKPNNVLLSSLCSQLSYLLFYPTGVSIKNLEIVYGNE